MNKIALNEQQWIWGLHSISAALESFPEVILELYSFDSEDRKLASTLKPLAQNAGIKIQAAKKIPDVLREKRHQGCWARLRYFPTLLFKDFMRSSLADGGIDNSGQWLFLDRMQDPRNFGAILRSAGAFGVKGVFIADRHQAPLSGTVAQTSSGVVFKIPIIVYSSANRALEELRSELFFERIGLDMQGESLSKYLKKLKKRGDLSRLLWVLGAEGEGLRDGISANLDQVVSIEMHAQVESLNVSVAGSIAFFAAQQEIYCPS